MSFSVNTRPKAMADVRRITGRISATVSPSSAAKWHDELLQKILTLAEDPRVWPEADEAANLGRDLRMMPYGRGRHKYRVLFTIDGDIVNVLRVLHAAQDYAGEDDL